RLNRADPSILARFLYSRELQLRSSRLLVHKLITANYHHINCGGEWRFNFDTVLIAKLLSAGNISDFHRAVARKFPDRLILSPRHSPFADDAGIPARSQQKDHRCESD